MTNDLGLDRAPVEFQKLVFLRPPNMQYMQYAILATNIQTPVLVEFRAKIWGGQIIAQHRNIKIQTSNASTCNPVAEICNF